LRCTCSSCAIRRVRTLFRWRRRSLSCGLPRSTVFGRPASWLSRLPRSRPAYCRTHEFVRWVRRGAAHSAHERYHARGTKHNVQSPAHGTGIYEEPSKSLRCIPRISGRPMHRRGGWRPIRRSMTDPSRRCRSLWGWRSTSRLTASLVMLMATSGWSCASTEELSPPECYQADLALGPAGSSREMSRPFDVSASSDLDTAWYQFRLDSGGRASRPTLGRPSMIWQHGRWRIEGDSLLVDLTNGSVGWRLSLGEAAGGGYAGTALYRSDVVASGVARSPRAVRARRVDCGQWVNGS
jgi:hypothetical protein